MWLVLKNFKMLKITENRIARQDCNRVVEPVQSECTNQAHEWLVTIVIMDAIYQSSWSVDSLMLKHLRCGYYKSITHAYEESYEWSSLRIVLRVRKSNLSSCRLSRLIPKRIKISALTLWITIVIVISINRQKIWINRLCGTDSVGTDSAQN